ncbi:hypothetical protein [Desulfofundulus thermosubterraneus]|uniref:hypothetical protein n=1 Tax=Desulfofundulus thermosubterraneus TaxID=348840 RepID=UPI0010424048|nr:hypothetical protein [Desulfofundulus thermosubterraneus]
MANVWVHSLKTLQCFEAIVNSLNINHSGGPSRCSHDSRGEAQTEHIQLLALPGYLAGSEWDYLRKPVTRTRSRMPVVKLACLFHDTGKLETRAVGGGGRFTFYNYHTAGATVAAAIGGGCAFPAGRWTCCPGWCGATWTPSSCTNPARSEAGRPTAQRCPNYSPHPLPVYSCAKSIRWWGT